MNQHFQHSSAATGADQANAAVAMMAPPFSAEARARFQQVLAAIPANVVSQVNGVPSASQPVADLLDLVYSIAQTGNPATYQYLTSISLTGGQIEAYDYYSLRTALDDILTYETNNLQHVEPLQVVASGSLAVNGAFADVLYALTPNAIVGNVSVGALVDDAANLFDSPDDPATGPSAGLLLLLAAATADTTITVTGGTLSFNHVTQLAAAGTLDLSGAGVIGEHADFFNANSSTLSAAGITALDAHPGSVTISDGLSMAQRAAVVAANPGHTVSGPLTDSIANLATYNADNQDWDIKPGVSGFGTINVTDSSVPAGLLLSLLRATNWSGHIATPNAYALTGSLNEIDNTLGYGNNISLPQSAVLSPNEPVLDVYYALDFISDHPGVPVNAAGVQGLDGTLDQLTTLLGQNIFTFSGHEKVNVREITVADLAGAKTLIAGYSDGLVTATLRDTAANLVSQNPSTHVWSANAAISAGSTVLVGYESNSNMAIAAVMALVKAVGVNGHVDASSVERFTGTLAEVQQLRDSGTSTYYYGLTVTDAAVNASTLIDLRDTTVYSVQTTAATITGTAGEINTLFFHPNDYAVLSSTVNIALTSQLRVVDLIGLRTSYAEFTSGTVTGTLRDSVQNLTGHLTDSVGGYSVIDTVAVLSAHGAIVAGAKHLALADTIAHLAGGHTTAGGATSYTVVDTLDNLLDNDGSITGGAERIIAADTVAHLDGHTQDGGASGYTLIDSLSNITAASDSLLGAAMGVKLTDTIADVESLAGWSDTVFKASVDARGLTGISGHIEPLLDVLANTALTFSGSEKVTVLEDATAAQVNLVDAATTGVVSATVSGTAAELSTLTGKGNLYDVTVTDSASISQLTAIDAATDGALSYTSVTDNASHLATLKNGVWSANGYIHDGTSVMVLGDISADALKALDAANGAADVILAAPAATDFVIATSASDEYQILANHVYNVIDVAGAQEYHIGAPGQTLAGPASGGVLNLSGSDGQNTIIFDGYAMLGQGAHLTMTQSGTTAIFWDQETHMEVAAISMSADHAPVQNLVFGAEAGFQLTLVGSVITLAYPPI
jgi:hypothetical protein